MWINFKKIYKLLKLYGNKFDFIIFIIASLFSSLDIVLRFFYPILLKEFIDDLEKYKIFPFSIFYMLIGSYIILFIGKNIGDILLQKSILNLSHTTRMNVFKQVLNISKSP